MPPLATDQVTSPTTICDGVSGVASMLWKTPQYLSLMKNMNVVSSTAPFIAEVAIRPGATKSR
jgi:hypothetical protein